MASKDNAATGELVQFPDLKKATRRKLLADELGTQFDVGQRLFAYYGSGDVFDYGEWTSRDMKAMFRRDGICSAVENVLTLPIREADWEIRPGHGDKGEAEFVRSVMASPDSDDGMATPVSDLIGQITSGQIFRRAFFEKVWKIRDSDGKIIYDKIAFRPPSTCQARYDSRTGAKKGFRQQVWLFGGQLTTPKQQIPGYVDIPEIRSYVYTHGKAREPLTGLSEMDICYWCYQTKMKLLYLWYHFLENTSLPRVIVYGNDQPEANQRADDIASLKSSGVVGLIHPADGQKSFDMLAGDAQGGAIFKDAMAWLESWQTHSVLAGFMALTGSATGGRGSYALSQDQSSFYLKSRQAVAKEIAESISFDLIRPLVLLNFGTEAVYPQWHFGPLQDEQIQALLTMFQTLAAAPALHIPLQVLDLITERMASILQLDIDQVHAALTSTANQRAEQMQAAAPPGMPSQAAGQLGALNGMANAAVGIARASQAGGAPPRPGASLPTTPAPGAQRQPPRTPSTPPQTPPPGRMA
ncbi:MAG TPA: DUF935 family protein [Streptosporangiaceae bacterium]|nr:DUF935 family protein [Streptosporangiaceae bacterium]